jgi:APA family basic amino acid/polyamine antiporter
MVFVLFLNELLAGSLSPIAIQILTAATIVGVILLNLASVRVNGIVAAAITWLKILLVVGIGLSAFVLGDGSWTNFAASGAAGSCAGVDAHARLGLAGFGAATVSALWAYNGWADLSFVAGEVRDPARTLPRATILASVVVIVLYLLINAAYFYALGAVEIANAGEDASVVAMVVTRLLGAGGAAALTAGLMLSTLGALHSTALSVSRIPYAMARDGLLPSALARVSPKTRVPANAVLVLGACALGFAFSGTFDVLTDLIVFVLLFFNGLGVASVYVLRRKLPALARPYRTWGYPIVPALFLGASVYLMVNTLLTTPGRALAGIGIVGAGLPIYLLYARRLPPNRIEDWVT